MISPVSRRLVTAVIALLISAPLTSQSQVTGASRSILNSERIAATFGSYGIDVLEHTADVRISSLYSIENGQKISRTFAVVVYPDAIEAVLEAEHDAILSGQSIGALFTRRGWAVDKIHRYFGVLDSTDRIRSLMGGISEQSLAVHVYDLAVSKGGISSSYATIAEVHHPDYLELSALREIYVESDTFYSTRGSTIEQILALTSDKMN